MYLFICVIAVIESLNHLFWTISAFNWIIDFAVSNLLK